MTVVRGEIDKLKFNGWRSTVGLKNNAPLIITTHSYIPPHCQLSNQCAIIATHANITPGRLNGSHKAMNTQLFSTDSEHVLG